MVRFCVQPGALVLHEDLREECANLADLHVTDAFSIFYVGGAHFSVNFRAPEAVVIEAVTKHIEDKHFPTLCTMCLRPVTSASILCECGAQVCAKCTTLHMNSVSSIDDEFEVRLSWG